MLPRLVWRNCTVAARLECAAGRLLCAFATVAALAARIASFDKRAISETKRLVNIASLPSDAEIAPEWNAFIDSLGRPASQTRIKALMARGFHQPGDAENRLGYYVGQVGRL